MTDASRLVVVTTTPGPAKCLSDAVLRLRQTFRINLLASRDPHYGGAGYIYDRHSIRWHSVESRLEDYAPLHVTEAQANSILDWLSPDVVLCGAVRDASGERRSLEDAVCFAALSRRIPVLQFVEGWEVWYPRTWTERLADRYLVIDEKAQALLQSYGVQDPYIGVVGYPRSLFDPEVIDLGTRRLVRAKLLDHDGRRLIVCFGQVTTDNAKTLSWIAHCLEPADVLVFQRHPRDQRSSDELFRHCPPGSVRESDVETDQIFHAMDCCVSHYSLTTFTAAYLGIPTILTLLPKDVPRIRSTLGAYPSTTMGGTVEAHDAVSFRAAFVRLAVPTEAFRQTVRESITRSTERIVDEIRSAHETSRTTLYLKA